SRITIGSSEDSKSATKVSSSVVARGAPPRAGANRRAPPSQSRGGMIGWRGLPSNMGASPDGSGGEVRQRFHEHASTRRAPGQAPERLGSVGRPDGTPQGASEAREPGREERASDRVRLGRM